MPAVRKVLEATALLDVDHCAQVEVRLLNRLGQTDRLRLGVMTEIELWALPTQTVVAISTRASTAALVWAELVGRGLLDS